MAMSPEPVGGGAISAPYGRPAVRSGNALAVASMLTWAVGFPAVEVLLQSWPPLALNVARLALAACVMFPIWFLIDGPARILNARWRHAVLVGGVGMGVGTVLLLLAQKLTDPVTVAIILSCAPLIATILEQVSGTRRMTRNFAFGLLASVVGGLIATSAIAPAQLGLGAVCAVLSTCCFCWSSLATARDFPDLSQMGRTTITMLGGLVVAGLLLFGAGKIGMTIRPAKSFDLHQAGMLAIYALVAVGLSQMLFISSIGKLGVAVASFHMNIAPFYVMVIMVMLGDEWSWTRALGAGIVALGVVLAQDRRPEQTA